MLEFLRIPQKKELPAPFTFVQVLAAFSIFFVVYGLILPGLKPFIPLDPELLGLLLFSLALLLFVAVTKNTLFPYFREKGFKIGAASWLLAFPVVALWSLGVEEAISWLTGEPKQDQLAVSVLKGASKESITFWFLVGYIVVIVPVMEEILFRGFLQNWLRRYFNPPLTIGVTSLIFAFFHFAPSQGLSNITIVSSLFMLSCFLGALLYRTGSLRAPIALHSVFNGFSVLMILLGGEG
jgi:membrane protease YdiL (CAAX protease family)